MISTIYSVRIKFPLHSSCDTDTVPAPAPAAHLRATGGFERLYPGTGLCKQMSEEGVSTGLGQIAIVYSLRQNKGQRDYHRLKGGPRGNITF